MASPTDDKVALRRRVRGFLGERAVVAVWSVAALVIAYRFLGRATDDIYITYRYAWNLAHGNGLVFNPGERVFGVSDPGVALLLGWLHWLTRVPVPRIGTLLTAGWLVGSARELLRAAADRGRRLEGLLGGTLLVTSPYLWTCQGSGPLAALFFLLAAARRARRWPAWAGLLAGLAFWCRPDAAPAAALLGVLAAAGRDPSSRERRGALALDRRLARRYAGALAATVLVGCAAAQAWFGTVLPETLGAKRAFAALHPGLAATPAAFWGQAWELFTRWAGPLAPVVLALGLAGQLWLLRRCGLAGRLLALHAAVIALAYSLLGVPFFIWYTAPVAAALLFAAPFPLGALARGLAARGPAAGAGELATQAATATWAARVGAALAAALLVAAPLSQLAGTVRWFRGGNAGEWRSPAYTAAGLWLRAHAPHDAAVACQEVGIIAYTSRRPVLDLIGLVSPASRPYAAAGDPVGAFLARPSEYVLFHDFNRYGGTRPLVVKPWFGAAYEVAARLRIAEPPGTLWLFRRRPGAPVPPPRPPRQRRPPPAESAPSAIMPSR